jgi:hypothetical protein
MVSDSTKNSVNTMHKKHQQTKHNDMNETGNECGLKMFRHFFDIHLSLFKST